ncbi:undecaprenol kinase [Verrucomicrobium sp. GAS474]|uniref:diacylglycerol kinase family protein n=1 Tax=Verrucomicrobium sp. GAS474 TaxID=1882831 RepID=UPI00087D4A5B|nr:diacylglycerol kinase family protein [Verrucomicrobium sp. GAS474]SDT86070.1 undecaprenol kinase [Verrucomicrobium sp. GAS474]
MLKFLQGFVHALRGGFTLLRTQRHARIHAVATVVVIALAASMWPGLERWEWAALALAVGLVWTAEALNTAVEFLADRVTRDEDPLIKKAKDVAAFGVLAAALAAASIGGLVFLPHLF